MLLTEQILVIELRKGNAKAYEELYKQFHKRLYNYCCKLTHSETEAQGLVQEIFIAIWENREKLDENKSFSGFIFKIARNKCLNVLKHKLAQQVYRHYLYNSSNDHNDLRAEIEYTELNNIITKSINALPERRKQIFLLSRNDNLTYKEIATKLEISENIVDHEIRKALMRIKDDLGKLRTS